MKPMESWGCTYVVSTDPVAFHPVKTALESKGIVPTESEIAWIAKQSVHVEGADAQALLKLIEALEDLDDVQKVDANFDMDVSELAGAE